MINAVARRANDQECWRCGTLSDRSLGESRKAVDVPRGHAHRGVARKRSATGRRWIGPADGPPGAFVDRDQVKALLLVGDEVLINRIPNDIERVSQAWLGHRHSQSLSHTLTHTRTNGGTRVFT